MEKHNKKKEAAFLRPPCVLDGKSVLRLCLIFDIHKIQRDIAINGVSGANTTNSCNCFAQYQVTFNGNIALPETATTTPIAVAISVNGEPRLTSRAIFTPAAVEEFGNVTSTAIIKVPRCCCFSLSVDAVPATTDPTVTPAPVIEVQNANLTIARIA